MAVLSLSVHGSPKGLRGPLPVGHGLGMKETGIPTENSQTETGRSYIIIKNIESPDTNSGNIHQIQFCLFDKSR